MAEPPFHRTAVGKWNFDNPADLGAASYGDDLSVYGNARYVSNGKFGGALYLDGDGDYLGNGDGAVPSGIPVGNSAYTIAVWIKAVGVNQTEYTNGVVGWGNYGSISEANALRLSGTTSAVNYWWGADLYFEIGDHEGTWTHLACTLDAVTGTRTCYVNGVPESSNTGLPNVQSENFRIGCTNGGEWFKG